MTVAALVGFGGAGTALAARVLVLGHDGHVRVKYDPFVTTLATPTQPAARVSSGPPMARASAHRTVRSILTRLFHNGAITSAAYQSYLGSWYAAQGAVRQLRGTRAFELESVIQNIQSMAARGLLGRSRLSVLFLTLDRNRQWWTTSALPATYQRVQFQGSELTWEYYPGQGLELQVLANFSTASALCNAGPKHYTACAGLLSELIPLAANRAGGMTWEYYFQFDGGLPPWTSAMSQGTALQALADAYRALHNPWYLTIGNDALPAFTVAPPRGVAVATRLGARYVQYTFDSARRDEIINAFLQSLIGLDDYARTSQSPLATQLFAAGSAEAQAELPAFDTGAWSLYQPGIEDDLSYHQLVTGFLQRLCGMTHISIYCTTGQRFALDLKTPPALSLMTTHLRRRRPGAIYFHLSKVSRVGITLVRGTTTVFLTSASFSYGTQSFAIPALRRGTYTVRVDATDLAGNFAAITGTVHVT